MKRFLSVLLVAILIVTSLTTVAFAATEVKNGDEVTFSVTVSGDEYTDFKANLSTDSGLEIVDISGPVTYNGGFTSVAYANSDNVTDISFEVTVKVTATAPGTYNAYASVVYSSKYVGDENDTEDGVVDGYVDSAASCSGASFVIPEPECEHENDGWKYDATNHWHVCKHCGDVYDKAAHELKPVEADGMQWTECECGYATEKIPVPTDPQPTDPQPTDPQPTEPKPTDPQPTEPKPTEPKPTEPKPTEPSSGDKDPVADTGDATPYGLFNTMIAVLVLAMVSAVVFVFKRKTAK